MALRTCCDFGCPACELDDLIESNAEDLLEARDATKPGVVESTSEVVSYWTREWDRRGLEDDHADMRADVAAYGGPGR